jgi:hypothetical protein
MPARNPAGLKKQSYLAVNKEEMNMEKKAAKLLQAELCYINVGSSKKSYIFVGFMARQQNLNFILLILRHLQLKCPAYGFSS